MFGVLSADKHIVTLFIADPAWYRMSSNRAYFEWECNKRGHIRAQFVHMKNWTIRPRTGAFARAAAPNSGLTTSVRPARYSETPGWRLARDGSALGDRRLPAGRPAGSLRDWSWTRPRGKPASGANSGPLTIRISGHRSDSAWRLCLRDRCRRTAPRRRRRRPPL